MLLLDTADSRPEYVDILLGILVLQDVLMGLLIAILPALAGQGTWSNSASLILHVIAGEMLSTS